MKIKIIGLLGVAALSSLLTGCTSTATWTANAVRLGVTNYRETWHIDTLPKGAEIYVDGNDVGTAPLDYEVNWGEIPFKETGTVVGTELDSGNDLSTLQSLACNFNDRYLLPLSAAPKTVQATKNGYVSTTRSIQISSGDEIVKEAVQAIPFDNSEIFPTDASIEVDDDGNKELHGISATPLNPEPDKFVYGWSDDNTGFGYITSPATPLDVKGQRTLLITLPPAQQTIVVPSAGGNEDKHGIVLVTSDPPNAEVDADGVFVGDAPANLKLDDGIHIIEVKLNGYKPYKKEMRVLAGSELNLKVQLEK